MRSITFSSIIILRHPLIRLPLLADVLEYLGNRAWDFIVSEDLSLGTAL